MIPTVRDPSGPDRGRDHDEELDDWADDEAERDDDEALASLAAGQLALAQAGGDTSGSKLSLGARSIALVAAIGLAEGVLIVGGALLVRQAIDDLIRQAPAGQQLALVLGGLVAAALGAATLRSAEFAVSEAIGYRYVARVRMEMYAHVLRTSSREMLRTSTGGVLLRFMGDLTSVRTFVSRGIARAIVSIAMILVGLVGLAILDLNLAPVALGTLLAGVGLSLFEGREVRRSARSARRQRANLATNLADQIHAVALVQSMGRAEGEYRRFGRQNARLTVHLLRYANVRAVLRAVAGAAGSLALVGVLAVGSLDVTAGRASLGSVLAAMLVVRQLARPVRTLGLSLEYWQTGRVSREKILAFLARPHRKTDASSLNKLLVGRGRIEFRDVRVEGSLNGITAVAAPGQIVAILGPNGAGKSTLLSVIARITDPDAGDVLVDDQSLAECTLTSCAARISMMGPALPLVRGSLRRNLLYRWPDAPDAELTRVTQLCRVDEIIAALPGGLQGAVKEGAANLSAGQAARVALARSLVGNPKILLLDEPTASLDETTTRAVHEIIARYGGTVLLATNDPQEAALADTVWRLEDGRIAEVIAGAVFRERIAESPVLPTWARAAGR